MGVISNQGILDKLNNQFPDAIYDVSEPKDLLTFTTGREQLLSVISYLKEDASLDFRFLTDLTGVHYPDRELPLGVVYPLQSMALNRRLRLTPFNPLHNPTVETQRPSS